MLGSKSSCLDAFDFIANSSGWRLPLSLLHIYDVSHKADVHRHCLYLAAFIPTFATLPKYFITFFHLHSLSSKKLNLWKHGLLFPIFGHWSVLHSPPLPCPLLKTDLQLSLFEEAEAHRKMHNQRHLDLHLWSSEKSQQERGIWHPH